MIQETRCGLERDEEPRGDAGWLESLRRLPQPLHILEFVGNSQHYHFGCFEQPGDALRSAQDRMSLRGARHFAAEAAVLDIGCGLGGTSRLLSELGLDVTALDPSHEALVYARSRTHTAAARARPRFLAQSLETYARSAPAALDGAFALEVLQHFPDLAVFFACCRRLLRPGATLVLHDVSTCAEVAWARVPHHRRGRVQAAAEAAGFQLCEQDDLSAAILPTLPSWTRDLVARRAELIDAFDGGRPGRRPVERELEQLLAHMSALQRAFENGELFYEAMVFHAGLPRNGSPCA